MMLKRRTRAVVNTIAESFFFPLARGIYHKLVRRRQQNDDTDFADDVIQRTVLRCIAKLDNWDPRAGRGYSYFTKVCKYFMWGLCKDEARHRARFISSDMMEGNEAHASAEL